MAAEIGGTLQPEAHHVRVARTARYYVLGDPAGDVRDVWVVCHGYSQLARSFIRHFSPIAAAGRLIVAPEALNRYYQESAPGVHGPDARVGATWMTREDRDAEIRDYVEYLDALAALFAVQAPPPRIIALGFSQGAATVSRWAAMGSTHLEQIILWGSRAAHDLELHADVFRGVPVTLMAGSSDRYMGADAVAAEEARLAAAGVRCRVVHYDGGHRVEEHALRLLL